MHDLTLAIYLRAPFFEDKQARQRGKHNQGGVDFN